MERAHFWLLDIVVEYFSELPLLIDDNLELILNRDGHGLDEMQLVEAIHALMESKDIVLFYEGSDGNHPGPALMLTKEEIKVALNKKPIVYYALTSQGGAKWESYTQPRWEELIVQSGSFDNIWESEAYNSVLIREYLDIFPYIWKQDIVADSITWTTLSPWQATYWKQLPRGVRAQCTTVDREWEPRPEWVDREWERLGQWYTNPFA